MRVLHIIFDFIFPRKCLSCGKKGSDLCQKCLAGLPEAERESAKWIFPMYDYRHPLVKKSIWLLKYNNKRQFAEIFAELMHGRILEELADLSVIENFRNPILIPIPLAPKRMRERGFNQALLICKKLMELNKKTNLRNNMDIDFILEKDVLLKPKDTEHQARIENRSQRLENIVGSFTIENGEKIKGKNIILIDDVTTTGATLSEAKKVLKQSGAKKIIAFTVAH